MSQPVRSCRTRAHGLVEDDVPPGTFWVARLDVLSKIAVSAVSIPVADVADAGWGMLCWSLLLIVGPLMGRWRTRVEMRMP